MSERKTVYIVEMEGKKHLVTAKSKAQAVRHVTYSTIKIKVARPVEVGDLMKAGIEMEDAGLDPEDQKTMGLPLDGDDE